MNFSRYAYQPIYIILYNFLRCRKKIGDSDFDDILFEQGYDGLKARLDVEEISELVIQAIESYLLKTTSIDFDRLIHDTFDDNLDYFMDISLATGSNYYDTTELNNAKLDVMCYFHNNYIYKNGNLNFEYVNKTLLYEDLSEEERDNELFVLEPILSAIGSMYSLGKVNYKTGKFELKADLKDNLESHIKSLSKESRDDLYYENDYYGYDEISSEYASELGIIYEVKDNSITITGYSGSDNTLYIPKTIDEVPVEYIKGLNDLKIKKLVIFADLKEVKNNSISYCLNLTRIELFGSLGLVGMGTFHKIKVPTLTWCGVTYLQINDNPCYLVLGYEDFLSTVNIERKCKSIRAGAFFGKNMRNVSAPSVEYIGEKAFGQCKNLQSIQLNHWLKGIGEYAFYICESLMNIKIDAKVLPPYLFYKCSSLKNVSIGKGVEELGLYSLSFCDSLKKVKIPASVHKIGQVCFEYTPLKELEFEKDYHWIATNDEGDEITISPDMLQNPEANVLFFKKHDDYDFVVDSSISMLENMTVKEAEEYGFELEKEDDGSYSINDWNKDEKICVIPKTIENLEVHSIGSFFTNNFSNKKNLEKLIVLANVPFVNGGLFNDCLNLQEITMNTNIKYINHAFNNCPKVSKYEGGVTYTKINDDPYYYAGQVDKNDTSIHFNYKTKILSPGLFYQNENITNCTLPDCEIIPDTFFYKAKNLQGIMIPDTVRVISNSAFGHCTSLNDVIFLGEELYELHNGAFERCLRLKKVHIPRGVSYIDKCCFEHCLNLKEVHLPSSVNTIGFKAFYNCISLDKVSCFDSNWVATEISDEADKIYFSVDYSTKEQTAQDFTALYRYTLTKYEGEEDFSELEASTKTRKSLKIRLKEIKNRTTREEIQDGTFVFD